MRSSCCVCVCVLFQIRNNWINVYEIWYKLYGVAGHMKTIPFIFLQSVMTTMLTREIVRGSDTSASF